MNQGWIYRERVKDADAGQTILEYYSNKYRHSSQQEWQIRIKSGQILLNERSVDAATILKAKDRLAYHRSPWNEPAVPLEFTVLYKDRDLLVINKPAGLPVMPGGGFIEHTLLYQLKIHYPQEPPVPIHRLGRGTSGLLLLARSPIARSHLARQMRDSTIKQNNSQINKVYRVLVSGNSIEEDLTITQPIGKIPHPVLGYIYGATTQGKPAKSQCKVIERYRNCTLLEVKIYTGRPHQIRIHLAAAGYPLLGDPLYVAGGSFAQINGDRQQIPVPGDCGYFLHAYRLALVHPRTLQKMNLLCPTPHAWKTVGEQT
ncbi:RluA family pseudouridine synthase [Pleurocapsales cyanobacterium LEGE 10410]|nr:RluA family pseudouridine synthase [Pleurocapsales cyanobacterium LEGE 10410]